MKENNNALIRLENVSKIYGSGESKVAAVNGVDLTIKEGEFVNLLGASGSGKSTLLHIIGAMDKPSSGKIYLYDKLINKMSAREINEFRLNNIGFIFQTFNLMPSLTVLENVMLPMRLNRVSKKIAKEKALELLTMVGLKDRINHIPAKLSGGQKQRVAIARALANDPILILADEPTGNLDSKNGNKIIEILTELNAKGHTILMVTHNEEIAERFGRIINMKDGQII